MRRQRYAHPLVADDGWVIRTAPCDWPAVPALSRPIVGNHFPSHNAIESSTKPPRYLLNG